MTKLQENEQTTINTTNIAGTNTTNKGWDGYLKDIGIGTAITTAGAIAFGTLMFLWKKCCGARNEGRDDGNMGGDKGKGKVSFVQLPFIGGNPCAAVMPVITNTATDLLDREVREHLARVSSLQQQEQILSLQAQPTERRDDDGKEKTKTADKSKTKSKKKSKKSKEKTQEEDTSAPQQSEQEREAQLKKVQEDLQQQQLQLQQLQERQKKAQEEQDRRQEEMDGGKEKEEEEHTPVQSSWLSSLGLTPTDVREDIQAWAAFSRSSKVHAVPSSSSSATTTTTTTTTTSSSSSSSTSSLPIDPPQTVSLQDGDLPDLVDEVEPLADTTTTTTTTTTFSSSSASSSSSLSSATVSGSITQTPASSSFFQNLLFWRQHEPNPLPTDIIPTFPLQTLHSPPPSEVLTTVAATTTTATTAAAMTTTAATTTATEPPLVPNVPQTLHSPPPSEVLTTAATTTTTTTTTATTVAAVEEGEQPIAGGSSGDSESQ